jgi:hypothetical protein
MSQRRVNFFEKIGNYIRGYKGYATREEKRNTDKKIRDGLAEKIRQSEIAIINHQEQLLKTGEMQRCQEWEIARKALNTVYSQIKNAVYGESSFFSEKQLKEDELDEIYSLDLSMTEHVVLIAKTVEVDINEQMSAGFITQQVKGIVQIINKRTSFINQFK